MPMPTPSPQYGPPQPQAPGFDMQAMLAAFAQAQAQQQQGRLAQQQDFFTQTNPLGATAAANSRPGGLTPGSQWSNMFGVNAASAMTPEARFASQGASATNQWAQMGQVPGVDPYMLQGLNQQVGQQRAQTPMPTPDYAGAAAAASPAPFQLHPSTLDMMNGRQTPTTPKKRKGSSFGMQATGNPRPGFSF